MTMRKTAKKEIPYKRAPISRPVVEDVALATKMFGGNKYEMIMVAAWRARVIAMKDNPAVMAPHKPTVRALMECQNGELTMAIFKADHIK
jgi:DNA-directed RNA polymerase omega subunit